MVSLTEKAAALYQGEALAPMVRASTTPLRTLALQYGADFVYSEEMVDRSLSDTIRVENEKLQTVDYIKDTTKLAPKVQRKLARDGNRSPLMFQVDRRIEKGKLVCQIGSGEPELALDAVLHVKQDVDAFDINMGCPKKFSVSGGMGSALLSDPDRACRIVKTLRDHLKEHPVSCKIRLLKDTQSTLDFITGLVNAGAHAIAVHARRPGDEAVNPAHWEDLEELMPLVRSKFPTLPLLINGDFYTRQEFTDFHKKYGTSGVLLARPALYNVSIFRKPPPKAAEENDNDATTTTYGYDSPLLLDKTTVVQEYLKHALRYNTHHKNVKYVASEMMTNRRTPTPRVNSMPVHFPGGQTIGKTCSCHSLEALCKLWDVRFSLFDGSKTKNVDHTPLPAGEHKYDDNYILQGEEPSGTTTSTATESKDNITGVSRKDTQDSSEYPNKRPRVEASAS
ncbi:dihydrouridine(20) synthase [Seminavis robusta]|uniref:Dihydrouridine(20) synthase n=1 Tax=Seminavis robusta TaxID=568900 RepID=A0A9N8HSN1_9STRA|nr:dihydrouridine(20) synthase [Seminavis robusta]|eukprot:Sro1543_g281160.1 dihydrouridine(20) synthase (451) ;mRNA; f:17184-18536